MNIFSEVVRILVLSGLAFIVALLITPLWRKILEKEGVKKQIRAADEAPVFSKLHEKKAGTPTGGGVIIWGTVTILASFFWITSIIFDSSWEYFNFISRRETYLPLAALLISALLGLFDDLLGIKGLGGAKSGGLKVRHKILIYTFIAAIGAWWFYFRLGRETLIVPFMGEFHIGLWYIPIFMFIIIASAFSANETDGLDGLLGGVSLFAFVALVTVAFTAGLYDLAAFGSVIIGSLLAFLWFNIYPAKFFMGDTGSMSLGITLGVIAMLTNTVFFLPLFGLIFVLESLSVIIQVISKKMRGKKIFLSTPLHHHFEALGWPESQVTMRFWILSAVASTLGLVLFFLARSL
jgi:phospho-N-acetylmuramoyl-pentapeptide-transferase